MRRQFESPIPRACARLRETRAADQAETLANELGELARVLAASRPGGVFLCAGDDAGEPGAWILDGMDLASRLVVVVDEVREAEVIRSALGDDLRVTVHHQDAVAFLEDVREQRFDLIADLGVAPPVQRLRLALARLAPGGLFLSRCPAGVLEESLAEAAPAGGGASADALADAFVPTRLAPPLDATLVARRPPPPEGKRRGGRRARAGVTPLFSSKSR